MKQRNRTLLVEYNQKDKASVFEDNRIGENNSKLTQDEKDLIRYQKETRVSALFASDERCVPFQ